MRMVEKLQVLLAERKMTQSAFEPMVGLPANRISKWAGGQGEPTARQALRMARLLQVPIEYLIDDNLERPPSAPASDIEKQIWAVVQTIGPDEAWRRLVVASEAQPRAPFYAHGQVVTDASDSSKHRNTG